MDKVLRIVQWYFRPCLPIMAKGVGLGHCDGVSAMTKDKRSKRDAHERMDATGERYMTARRALVEDVSDEADDYSARGIDDDSGYGPDSYFAHAMAKDD